MAPEEKEIRIKEGIEDVLKKVTEVNTDFLELAPQEWVLRIMKALRKCALNVSNYKEFREGLVETGALVLIVMMYSDHLFREYLSKPAPHKLPPPPTNNN